MSLKLVAVGRLFGTLIIVGAAMPGGHAAGRQTAPPAPGQLQLSAVSQQAKALFRDAWVENQNVAPVRARQRIAEAVKADPQFSLARVYEAFLAPGTAAARAQAIADVIPSMKSASAPELLLAIVWREQAAGRLAAALPVLRALAELAPDDPEIAWMYVNNYRTGKSRGDQAVLIRAHMKRFPTHAASRNTLAYLLHAAGDTVGALAAAEEYVRLLPKHPNSHDTLADLLMLLERPSDALPHAQQARQLGLGEASGLQKIGAIALMMGEPVRARADFARGLELASTPDQKLAFMHWSAATHALAADGKAALGELSKIVTFAESQNLPAEARIAHERMAVVEAYLGDSRAVGGHITMAGTGTPPLAHHGLKAIAYARIGDLAEAGKAAEQYRSMAPAINTVHYTLGALIALQANDLATAEKELAGSGPDDLFAKALRADLLLRKGQKTAAEGLLRQLAASSVKLAGAAQVDSMKLVARMHAGKL